MKKAEYIKAIKAYNKEMTEIDNNNYLLSLLSLSKVEETNSEREKTSNERIDDTILKLISHGKELANTQIQVDLDEFRKYVANLNFDVNDECELGGIAHKLILCGIPLKDDYRIRTGMNFTENTLKELAISEFLKKGLNPNLKDEMGYTFIETAIFGRPDCSNMIPHHKIEQLSEYLAEYNYQSFEYLITNRNANSSHLIVNLINEAKKYGFDVNTKDNLGNSIVHTAISSPYFCGNIVDLIKALGKEFDINARNNKGQDIIEFLDYCIENEQAYSEYPNKKIIDTYKNYLSRQKMEIEEFIMLNRNSSITSSEIKANFSKKLENLKKQREINTRMATFLDVPYNKIKFDLSTITTIELNSLLQQELETTKQLVSLMILTTKHYFGKMYKIVCKLVMQGKETVIISGTNHSANNKFSIESMGESFKPKILYPYEGTITEKIKWLHDVIEANNEREKEIADNVAKAKARVKKYN